MALQIRMQSCDFVSFSRVSLSRFSQSCPFTKPHVLFAAQTILNNGLWSDGSRGTHWIQKGRMPRHPMILTLSRAELDGLGEGEAKKEVDGSDNIFDKEDQHLERKQKANQLKQRLVSGLVIGVSEGGTILMGGWAFTVAVAVAVAAFIAASEYFELVNGVGMPAGIALPHYLWRICSVICALLPIWTLYFDHIDIFLTFAAFIAFIALLLQREDPCFHQLTSAFFGLFYCGYLPCFWVKLRCSLSVPALNTKIGHNWPVLLGGQTHWTVGLVATLLTVSSIIAADTYAFLGGKAFGRTPLTNISPKKTWEGALMGFASCIATSVLLSRILSWPRSLLSTIALGLLNFFGSLSGDLMESVIKRDAGVKDSGSLIPGHGGILDRADSYIFTGALVYSFIITFLPLFGV